MVMTYKSTGVDIASIKKSQGVIGKIIAGTHKAQDSVSVEHGFGHYAGIVQIAGGGPRIATHTDGVGTKVLVAGLVGRYDTVGIDCVAMNVNDIICTGATPISFVNYIAANKNDESKIADIVRGLARGAKRGMVPIVGGETAIMPGIFGNSGKRDRFEFDLAGTVVGLLPQPAAKKTTRGGKNKTKASAVPGGDILGGRISDDDCIIGAYSTGLHSNGYTLARAALDGVSFDSKLYRGGPTMGDALLEPTAIYTRPVLEILSDHTIDVHGLAHITGGSFTKLLRLKKTGFEIDILPPVPRIMQVVMERGGIEKAEMYRTFNMGIGFCVIAPLEHASAITNAFARRRIHSKIIGRITKDPGVTVESVRIA